MAVLPDSSHTSSPDELRKGSFYWRRFCGVAKVTLHHEADIGVDDQPESSLVDIRHIDPYDLP